MKIGIDARLAFQTGVGRYIRNLLNELSNMKDENEYTVFLRKEDKDKIKLGKNFTKIIAGQRWHTFSEQTSFLRLINSQNLDLMHFTYFSHPIFYKRPYIVTIHDLIIYLHKTGDASTKSPIIYKLKHAAYKFAVRSSAKKATHIISPSHTTKHEIMKYLKIPEKKITVTYEGVENLPKEKKIKTPDKYFLYAGNAYPHKNVQFLLDTFTKFRTSHPDVHLLLVGPNDSFYKKLSLDTNSKVLHDITDGELHTLYKNSISLVHPSIAEGFGLTPLEAINSGTLALVSDIEVFREICSTSAIYFKSQNEKSLLKSLDFVYSMKKKEKEEKVKKAQKYIKKFSWQKMAKETKGIYEKLSHKF